ncbi:hypothetical protein MNBD_ALPHA07-45 [hydrothermal vent metagenome]|uniref:Cytochrome c oxidase subunit IV bacterial aa3 type domain-containing protein n=1 Tax=hydrothermal vent metagenome TaxID=652676 RepID=A0A3B0RR64_9ZZZZ
MAKHTHGEMNADVQEQTFEGFIKIVGWSIVVIIGILIFAALVGG